MGAKPKKKVVVTKWICDKCRLASFYDFDEACRHEETCIGLPSSGSKLLRQVTEDRITEKENRKNAELANDKLKSNVHSIPKIRRSKRIVSKPIHLQLPKSNSLHRNNDTFPMNPSLLRKKREKMDGTSPANRSKGTRKKAKTLASIFYPTPEKKSISEVKDGKSKLSEHRGQGQVEWGRLLKRMETKKDKNKVEKVKVKDKKGIKRSAKLTMGFNNPSQTSRRKEKREVADAVKIASIFQKPTKADIALPTPRKNANESTRIQQVRVPASMPAYRERTKDTLSRVNRTRHKNTSQLISATRFPNPSHVVGQSALDTKQSVENVFLASEQQKKFIQAAKYQCGRSSSFHCDSENYPYSLIDQSDHRSYNRDNEEHVLQASLVSTFQCSALLIEDNDVKKDISTTQLWRDKHTIGLVPDDVCGAKNKDTAENLMNFINEWRENRHQILSTRVNNKCNPWSREKQTYKDDDSDFDIWECSDEEDDSLQKIFLLTGPSGSGKTSLVYAVAKKCNYDVLEINTVAKRSGQDLKKAIEESTQSHSSFANLKRGSNADSVGSIHGNQIHSECDGPSLALVLIDEVDLLFESDGDTGFWQSLNNLTKKAKCPIILTSTSLPRSLANSVSITYIHDTLISPTPTECALKMQEIAAKEGMSYNTKDSASIMSGLMSIAKLCHCDLRRIYNSLELFSRGSVKEDTFLHFTVPSKKEQSRSDNTYRNPKICSVSPKIVSSIKHTVIKIQGENFIRCFRSNGKDSTTNHMTKFKVMVGNQICVATRILDDETILAVCPPCHLPSGVDISGRHVDTFEECLTCRYAPVVIQMNIPNGMIMRSDAPAYNIRSSDGSKRNLPYVTYNFPEESGDEELSLDEEDGSVIEALDKAVAAYKNLTKEPTDDKAQCLFSHESLPCAKMYEDLDQMHRVMQNAELASDAALLEDLNHAMSIPELSGPVRGFGFDLIGDANLLGSEAKAHQTIENVLLNDWNDSSFFFGTSNAYMTRPMSQRDRFLASETNEISDMMESLQSELISPNSLDAHDNHKTSIDIGNKDGSETDVPIPPSEEDSVSLPIRPPFIRSLPSILRRAKLTRSDYPSLEKDVRSYLIKYEKEQKSAALLQIIRPIIGELCIMVNPSDFSKQDLHHCMVLDYIPSLRSMAYMESILEKKINEIIKTVTGDGLKSVPSILTRRQTRSTRKGHKHYFSSFFPPDEFGKAAIAKLADAVLCKDKEECLSFMTN